ncbi:hypothetical protein JXJ21_12370 [candidate division KSB1 bacterium]|nr:hypothetical protein [candidate division KSB1 bacterium]
MNYDVSFNLKLIRLCKCGSSAASVTSLNLDEDSDNNLFMPTTPFMGIRLAIRNLPCQTHCKRKHSTESGHGNIQQLLVET